MATECLVALSKENQSKHPKTAQTIRNDFYMYDLITGLDTEEECCELHRYTNSFVEAFMDS